MCLALFPASFGIAANYGGASGYYESNPNSYSGTALTGNAGNNTVYVDEPITGHVVGGEYSGSGDVINNTVVVKNTTVGGMVVGGHSQGASSMNNTVTIDNSTVGSVYVSMMNVGTEASNNTLYLKNAAIVSGEASGGHNYGNNRNNTLIVEGIGNKVGRVDEFQKYEFIATDRVNAGDVLLTVTGGAATDMQNQKVGVAMMSGGNPLLKQGDVITLMHNDSGVNNMGSITQTDVTVMQGVSLEYKFELDKTGTTDLNAILTEAPKVANQTKAVSESRLAGAALVNQGIDLAADQGMRNARAMMGGTSNAAAFGAIGGGSSTYHTGSSVKVDGFAFMAGIGKNFNTASGDLMAGVFIEGGYGDIDTHNNFDSGSVKGSGDSKYYGAGVMARYDVTSTAMKGTYLEGSLHVGRVKTNWDTSDMIGADGKVSNDTSNMYYGLHAGVGYVWNLTSQANLDLYGKYYWSHQGSDSATVGGDKYDFDSTDSHRTRVGGRLNLNLTETVRPYIGAAWEHEFDGESNAQVYGFDVAAPTLEGDSGIFELGFSFKPVKNDNVTFDLGVQAYTGVREGVAGTAQFNYKF